MRVGIDISQIIYGSGVSRYTKSLCVSLLENADENFEFLFFGGSLRRRKDLNSFVSDLKKLRPEIKIQKKISFLSPNLAHLLFNKLHFLPLEIFTGDIDIFHSSDWTQPKTKALKVTTIHDLAVLRYPETFPKRIISAHKKRLEWVKKEADLIIVVSESTKKDIIDLLKIKKEKIKVIYEGVNENFKPQGRNEIKRVREKYNLKENYFLSVSTLEPRKNLKTSIKAFNALNNENKEISFALAGRMGWGDLKKMGVDKKNKNIKLLGFVTDEDLPALYSGAVGFIYPSLYEGFGLPALEAMACATPVITSNVSSLPEVAVDAGILIDPLDNWSLAKNMEKLLKDDQLRAKLIAKGIIQAKKFSWQKTAVETLKVYEEIFKQNKK
ncbi:glycosyltransferase family 4 protein [Patescibacteria group bacterium]|nr:glycosyltransferase family 4 protein [Patescibacteria group bacterium]